MKSKAITGSSLDLDSRWISAWCEDMTCSVIWWWDGDLNIKGGAVKVAEVARDIIFIWRFRIRVWPHFSLQHSPLRTLKLVHL